jgi:hypothetical protein
MKEKSKKSSYSKFNHIKTVAFDIENERDQIETPSSS